MGRLAPLAASARAASLTVLARAASLVADRALRLLRERRAGLAIIFALSAIPAIGLVGVSADFAFCNQAKAQLDLAADAAAIEATNTASAAFVASKSNYLALGQTAGTQWFTTQVGLLKSFVPSTVTPTVTISQNGGVFTSTVQYSASVTSNFGRMFGVSNYRIGGSSATTVTTSPYVDITFLLDNSSSMLIPATQQGVAKLEQVTAPYASVNPFVPNQPCAFACHWDSGSHDYYGLARGNNIQLRFDVLQSAVATSIAAMQNLEVVSEQFGASIYTFNSSLAQVYPTGGTSSRGTNLSAALTAAQGITTPVSGHLANTYFPTIMAQLAANAPAAGDGSTSSTPKKALIIVTDGLMDDNPVQSIPTTEGPMNPSDCAAMKAKGYDVYVLYTTYFPYVTVPPPGTSDTLLSYNAALAPYLTGSNPTIVQNLTACASAPGNFQQASDSASIQSAMQTLVLSALSAGTRVSQ